MSMLGSISPPVTDYAEIARRPLDPAQCALLVVDIQEKLLPPIFQKEQLVRNSQLLIRLAGVLNQELTGTGIQIAKFIVENISLPPEVEQALDRRTQMGIVGDLGQYTRFQTANAIGDAANNPGGGAGEGLGIGMGVAMGQQMAAGFAQQAPAQQPAGPPQGGPPPLPAAEQWYLGAGGQRLGPFDAGAMILGDLAE